MFCPSTPLRAVFLHFFLQEIYELVNTLATPTQSQCNLLSLEVFKDGEIPQVPIRTCLRSDEIVMRCICLSDTIYKQVKDGNRQTIYPIFDYLISSLHMQVHQNLCLCGTICKQFYDGKEQTIYCV